jgi:hypothetical protein
MGEILDAGPSVANNGGASRFYTETLVTSVSRHSSLVNDIRKTFFTKTVCQTDSIRRLVSGRQVHFTTG